MLDSSHTKTFILWLSMIAMMGLNFLGSILVSKTLGIDGYGDLKFIQTLWMLLTLFFSFGIFHSSTRLLLIEDQINSKNEIIGAILILCIVIGSLEALFILIAAYPIDYLFRTTLKSSLMWLSPLVVTITLRDTLALVLQNLNKIKTLALQNVLPSFSFVFITWFLSTQKKLSYFDVLIIQHLTLLITLLIIIIFLKPSFAQFPHWLHQIVKTNKGFGWPIYLGSIANVASDYINRLAIAYWVNTTQVGLYSLSTTLVEPLKLVPSSIATSEYKNFSRQEKISRKLIIGSIIATITISTAMWFFLGQPLKWLYGAAFSNTVSNMSRLAMLGAILVGFSYILNRFLGAHGYGNLLRNSAYVMGGVNLIAFILLVPFWGAWGAIWGTIFGGGSYLASLLYYYYVLKNKKGLSNDKDGLSAN